MFLRSPGKILIFIYVLKSENEGMMDVTVFFAVNSGYHCYCFYYRVAVGLRVQVQ